MARTNTITNLKKSFGLLAIFVAVFTLAGCGDGDGQPSIPNSAVTPVVIPPGFCDAINFEDLCKDDEPAIINFNGGATVIVDNPDRGGLNDSAKVARMQKFGDATFGGTRFNPNEVPIDFSDGEVYKIKVWSEREVPVSFKLEERNDGQGGVTRVVTHTGGSEWQELCFSFSGATPARTIGLTIIFDDGVLGAAVPGVFAGDWTFYYDDITQVSSCDGTPAPGTTPPVTLYDGSGSPDLVPGTDYGEITAFTSGSVLNPTFADDDTFSPVYAVTSGTGYGANVAQIGFIGFDPGFLTAYESIIFKAKDLPNSVIFVSLFDGGQRLRINLTSSGFVEELDGGWYQLTIPLAPLSGLTTATGIVIESDNTAPAQFTMLLTDIGFGESSGGGGPPPPPTTPSLGVFSETNTSPTVNITDIVSAGNAVTIDTSSTAVTPFDGSVSLGLTFSTGGQAFGGAIFQFDDEDISSFDTLKFAIDTSTFANLADLTVQLEPPGGGTPGGNVSLSAYTPVSTTGNWDVYEIPLADFTAVNPAVVNRLGFFNARDGSDVLLAGTLHLDDIHFTTAVATPPPPPPGLGVFSETNTSPTVNITDIVSAGNAVTIDTSSMAVTAFDGTVSLGLTFSTGGQAFGGAIFQFDDEDISSYNTLKFAIDTSTFANLADLTVQLEPPGGGTPGGNVSLSAYTPVSTTGNWDVYEIPLADFTAVNPAVVNRLGFFNARDGSDVLLAGTLYLDDIHFTTVSGGGGGGSSVLVNGDFEDNGGSLDGWTLGLFDDAGGTLGSINADSSGQGGRGGTVARLIVAGSAASFNDAVISQEGLGAGTVTAGDTITVTFDVYGTVTQPGAAVFAEVIFLNAMGQDVGGRDFLDSDPTPLFPTPTWTPVSGTVTAGTGFVPNPMGGPYDVSGGLVLSLKVACGAADGCAQDISFDNVTFTIN